MLWAVGAVVLMFAFRVGRSEPPNERAPRFPSVVLVDWTSGWLLMLAFSLIGASASALWFRFANSAKFATYVAIAALVVFTQAGAFWLILKAVTRRRVSGPRGESR